MEYTVTEYVQSKKSLLAKIEAIDLLIDTMLLRATEATSGQNVDIEEYQLDDGQMKIRTRYRSINDIYNGVQGLETLKNKYVNQLNGRMTVFRSQRSFR